MKLVSVWPSRAVSGWDEGSDFRNRKTGRPVNRYPLVEAVEALSKRYDTDAHFIPYRIAGLTKGDLQPRVNDSARRSVLIPAGIEVLYDLLVIDVDAPSDIKREGTVAAWSIERIDRALSSDLGSGCGWYVTRGGFRLLWEVDALGVTPYLQTLAKVRSYLSSKLGIEADKLVDFNRCYRLPLVTRDGEPQVYPSDLTTLGPLPEVEVSASVFEGIESARPKGPLVVPLELVEGEEPGRKRTLFRLAAKLRDAGADEGELIAALSSFNASRCKPPLPVATIEAIARSATRYEPSPERVKKVGKRKVVVKPGDLPELVGVSEELLASSSTAVYQRAGDLVTVDREPDVRKGVESTPGTPVIRTIARHRLRVMLAAEGDWKKLKKASEASRAKAVACLTADGIELDEAESLAEFEEVSSDPPLDVVDALREAGRWSTVYPLVGVTETPTIRPDGSILDKPGYDRATGIVFSPPSGLVFPAIVSASRDEVRRALYALDDIVSDFPFGSSAHKAVALSAMLTAVGRFGIEGPTPLFLFDSHTRGSGKGLLANVVSVLCTGRVARVLSIRDDTETEKRITAHLASGKRIVLLDNVVGAFGGPSLDAALTADVWSSRVLGESRLIEVPNRATWIATGNNVAIRGDLERRTLRCYLDVNVERPEERKGFRHRDLITYVRKHRGRLVAACLTVLKAYVDAGRPDLGITPMGSFEAWSNAVRSALVFAGVDDPYETRQELRDGADREVDAWSTVLEVWHKLHGSRAISVPDVLEDLDSGAFVGFEDVPGVESRKALKEALVELAGGRTGILNPRRVGWVLSKYQSRIVNGRRLVRGDRSSSGRKWFVEDTDSTKSEELTQRKTP